MTSSEFRFLIGALRRLCKTKDYEGLEELLDEAYEEHIQRKKEKKEKNETKKD